MILNAYSLFDRKGMMFHAPFFSVSDGAAVRSCSDLVQEPNTTVARHPGDYVLYRIGAFDDSKGHLLPLDPVNHVVDLITLVPMEKQPDMFKYEDRYTTYSRASNGAAPHVAPTSTDRKEDLS